MKLATASILIFLTITGIYNLFGYNSSIWNALYFCKEDFICAVFSLILLKKEIRDSLMLLYLGCFVFFCTRFVFHVFVSNYANSILFSELFVGEIIVILATCYYIYKK